MIKDFLITEDTGYIYDDSQFSYIDYSGGIIIESMGDGIYIGDDGMDEFGIVEPYFVLKKPTTIEKMNFSIPDGLSTPVKFVILLSSGDDEYRFESSGSVDQTELTILINVDKEIDSFTLSFENLGDYSNPFNTIIFTAGELKEFDNTLIESIVIQKEDNITGLNYPIPVAEIKTKEAKTFNKNSIIYIGRQSNDWHNYRYIYGAYIYDEIIKNDDGGTYTIKLLGAEELFRRQIITETSIGETYHSAFDNNNKNLFIDIDYPLYQLNNASDLLNKNTLDASLVITALNNSKSFVVVKNEGHPYITQAYSFKYVDDNMTDPTTYDSDYDTLVGGNLEEQPIIDGVSIEYIEINDGVVEQKTELILDESRLTHENIKKISVLYAVSTHNDRVNIAQNLFRLSKYPVYKGKLYTTIDAKDVGSTIDIYSEYGIIRGIIKKCSYNLTKTSTLMDVEIIAMRIV